MSKGLVDEEKCSDFALLYDAGDRVVMKTAEDSLDRSQNRLEEIVSYAKEAGIQSIGIANCASVNKEAVVFEKFLIEAGFAVERVHCKYGKMPLGDILENYKGIACNPVGQAHYLEQKGTEINIAMGLCIGHDMLFNQKSHAPVSTLLVKDRKENHQTVKLLQSKTV